MRASPFGDEQRGDEQRGGDQRREDKVVERGSPDGSQGILRHNRGERSVERNNRNRPSVRLICVRDTPRPVFDLPGGQRSRAIRTH